MNIDWDGVFFAAFFGGLCLLVAFFANKEMEKDKDKIKDYCKKNGFTYNDNPESLLENYNNKYYTKDITKAFIQETAFLGIGNTFDIFSLGKYKRFSLGIMKQQGDMTIKIQDYFWCTKDFNIRTRSSSVFWNYILCQIEVKSLDLPDFFIRSRGFSDKFSTDKNDVEINFDSNFSKKFIVHSLEKEKTKEFFSNEKIRNAFIKHYNKWFSYKANGNYFLIYESNNNSDPNIKLRMELMENGLNILREIIDCQNNN